MLAPRLLLMWADVLLPANLATSLYMTGLIWFVQIVHYPLFASIPPKDFSAYEQRHQRFTSLVVAPVMLLELFASIALAIRNPSFALGWVAGAMTLTVWASTLFLQMPLHVKLQAGFDLESIRLLVTSNWVRTIAWSLRSLILLWAMTARTVHAER